MFGPKKLDDLGIAYEGSWYTIIGAGGDLKEWMNGYEELMKKQGIGKPSGWYTFSGSDVNITFRPIGHHRFKSDLTFLAFPLDGLDIGKLAIFKLQMQDRWFDDIIDNMERDG